MSRDSDRPSPSRIVLTYTDGEWVARDEHSGLTGRGETRGAALDALDDANEQWDGVEGTIPADDPLFSAGGLFAAEDSFDTRDVDDVVYRNPDR